MKWFKHMAASWDDEKLAKLVGAGGMDGLAMYGLYWRVLEVVSAQLPPGGTQCGVTYPVTRWSLLLSLRGSLVFSTLSRLAATGVVTVERRESDIQVTIPNLLKYRDEYARKSGHAQDNVPPRTEADGEADGEAEGEKTSTLASTAIAVTADRGKLLGTLPLNDGTDWSVYAADVALLQSLYPAVDVRQELRSMKGWLIGNPTHRKTRRGIKRFITSWLEKGQDKAKPNGGTTHAKPQRIDAIVNSHQGALDLLGRMDTPAYLGGRGAHPKPTLGQFLEGAHGPTVALDS